MYAQDRWFASRSNRTQSPEIDQVQFIRLISSIPAETLQEKCTNFESPAQSREALDLPPTPTFFSLRTSFGFLAGLFES